MDRNLIRVEETMRVDNWVNGRLTAPAGRNYLDKFNPHTGNLQSHPANSSPADVDSAIQSAESAFGPWSRLTPVRRGQILGDIAAKMKLRAGELADCVAAETGKPPHDAIGEVGGAILQAEFFAGEGMRLYARSLTSGMEGKFTHTVRQPRGIAGLIVPANTPIANIAWKVFPALVCGNSAVLKASEDAPRTAILFAEISKAAGLPDGVLNVIQGAGQPAGSAMVQDPRVAVISFTGSTDAGRWIAETAGKRLARISLELGGKNPFVVCDDADLELAVSWASLSAFSNAGQRCAAGSRILVFESVYREFTDKLVTKAKSLKLGVGSGCHLGPVITRRQRDTILAAVEKAKSEGAKVVCGGTSPPDPDLAGGFYVQPTLVEGLPPVSELVCKELFGPLATLHPVRDLEEAIALANATEYGLTAAIHTRDVDRAMVFSQRVRAGVANVNMGTYGSEPHMPFGGFGASGNGTREPGVEALDVYSELKSISFLTKSCD